MPFGAKCQNLQVISYIFLFSSRYDLCEQLNILTDTHTHTETDMAMDIEEIADLIEKETK